MESWRFQVCVVVFFALVQTYKGLSLSGDQGRWIPSDWQDESGEKSPFSQVVDIMKRSKALRFYGLMGKRSGLKQPLQMDRRRNKGEMFVGLMGRSISSGEALTQMLPAATGASLNVLEESREPDWREGRAQLQYYYS